MPLAEHNPEYMRHYVKHCAALCCNHVLPGAQQSPGPTQSVYIPYSGFILSVQDNWFFITAGHVLKRIEAYREAGYTLVDWQLDDASAYGEPRGADVDGPGVPSTLPFAFDRAFKYAHHDAATGQDYAFIHIEDFFRRGLEQNKVIPLHEAAWKDYPASFDEYQLIGMPFDQVEQPGRSGVHARRWLSIPVTKLDSETIDEKTGARALFNGRIPPPYESGLAGFKEVQGMSGGPIFGIGCNAKGERRYWVVAIQSTWDSGTQTISGSYVSSLAQGLEKAILEYHAERHESGTG